MGYYIRTKNSELRTQNNYAWVCLYGQSLVSGRRSPVFMLGYSFRVLPRATCLVLQLFSVQLGHR